MIAVRRHAAHERLAVIAIRGDDIVIVTQRRDDTGRYRFLANVEMTKATNLSDGVHLGAPLLEAALLSIEYRNSRFNAGSLALRLVLLSV